MYVYNPDYTWFYGSGPGRNATPPRWARLNLHRERERENGTNRPTYLHQHHGNRYHHGNGRGRQDGQQSRPPSSRPWPSHPRAHPPPAAPADTDGPQEGRRTDRQTPSAAKGPQHMDSNGHGHNAAPAGQSPPVISRTKRQRRPPQDEERKRKEKRKSTWTHGKPLFSKRKKSEGSERSNATFGLFERQHLLYRVSNPRRGNKYFLYVYLYSVLEPFTTWTDQRIPAAPAGRTRATRPVYYLYIMSLFSA